MHYLIYLALIAFISVLPRHATANHGPATSGGGVTVESAEPLSAGKTTFSLRENYTNYENLSQAEIESRAAAAGEFDYLRASSITTLGTAHGVTDNLDVSAAIGWYSGTGFVDAECSEHGGPIESSFGDPSGLTDLTVRGKYRVLASEDHSFALLGGVVAPTGDRSERLNNGSTLDPSSQPGTGMFGMQGGLAFTHTFNCHVKLDTSSLYTHRLERDGFRVGDRVDTGVALSLQFSDSHVTLPRLSFFGELNHIWLGKDESSEGRNKNSGGNSMFLTGGVRLDLDELLTFTVAPSVPVYQDSNGDQVEIDYRVTGTLLVRL